MHLTHAVVYLSMAPKSNALYMACERVKEDVRNLPAEPVPLQICNAPTGLMKELHYGEGYIYAHDTEEKLSRMQCLPDTLAGRRYYLPTDEGEEKTVKITELFDRGEFVVSAKERKVLQNDACVGLKGWIFVMERFKIFKI